MKTLKAIPKFNNNKEEAEFWDTHSAMDYFDFTNPIKPNKLSAPKKEVYITVRLDEELKDQITTFAMKNDISVSSLMRMGAIEKMASN